METNSIWGNANQLSDALEPFRTGIAQIVEYSCTHTRLLLYIHNPEKNQSGGIEVCCIRCNDISLSKLDGHTGFVIEGESRTQEGCLILSCPTMRVLCWDISITHHKSFNHMSLYRHTNG